VVLVVAEQEKVFEKTIKLSKLGELDLIEINQSNFSEYETALERFIKTAQRQKLPAANELEGASHIVQTNLFNQNSSFLVAIKESKIIGLSYQNTNPSNQALLVILVLKDFRNYKLGSVLTYHVLKNLAPEKYHFCAAPEQYGALRKGLYLGAEVCIEHSCVVLHHEPDSTNTHYVLEDKSVLLRRTRQAPGPISITYDPPDEFTVSMTSNREIDSILEKVSHTTIEGKLSNAEKHFKYVD